MNLRATPSTIRATPRRGTGPIQIVATPGSGNGRALDTARELYDRLRARRRDVRLELFDNLESLRRWGTTRGAGYSLLICVGGDGSQGAAATAALRRTVPFLPVPSGFGNLFAKALQPAHRVDRVVELVERGEVVHVDVGLRNGELFLCQESFGLLADIQARAEASAARPRSRWRRALAYYRTALRHLWETTPVPLQVTIDGRCVARDAVIVTVANVPTYGAWLMLTPAASPADGLFDVFLMRGGTTREILVKLLRRHLRIPGTERGMVVYRGRRVSIAAPSTRDEVELVPRRLPVVVSRETAELLGEKPVRREAVARIGRVRAA